MVPTSAIADAAYSGLIIDTSDLTAELTRSIRTTYPYRAEDKCKDSMDRIRDTHGITGLSIRHSQGLKQTQRFLSRATRQASFVSLFSSLKKRNTVHKAHLLSCREPEASVWCRAVPDPKFKSAIAIALWNTMVSLRLLIPINRFCSYCSEIGNPTPQDKYGHHSLVCRHKYGYTRRHNTIKDTIAQTAFRRCGMTVGHEPHNLGSSPSHRPDLYAPSTDAAYDITILSAYAPANVKSFAKALALQFSVAKPKNTSDMNARLAAIGPSNFLLKEHYEAASFIDLTASENC